MGHAQRRKDELSKMIYNIEFENTSVGRHRYTQCIQVIRTRAGTAGKEKETPSFEEQRKEGRLLRKFRGIGQPKNWIAEVENQLEEVSEGIQRQQLKKILMAMQKGDDPRVAEPELGMPDTRDYVLGTEGGMVSLEHDEKEFLIKRLKENRWFPDWAEFGVNLVEYITDAKGIDIAGLGNTKSHRVEKSA